MTSISRFDDLSSPSAKHFDLAKVGAYKCGKLRHATGLAIIVFVALVIGALVAKGMGVAAEEWIGKYYYEFVERYGFGDRARLGRRDIEVYRYERNGIVAELVVKGAYIESAKLNDPDRRFTDVFPYVVNSIDIANTRNIREELRKWTGRSIPEIEFYWIPFHRIDRSKSLGIIDGRPFLFNHSDHMIVDKIFSWDTELGEWKDVGSD